MMAPYLDMETIRRIVGSKTSQGRERLIENTVVPNFSELKNKLKKLRQSA
jgi:hypothetical protein